MKHGLKTPKQAAQENFGIDNWEKFLDEWKTQIKELKAAGLDFMIKNLENKPMPPKPTEKPTQPKEGK